MPSDEPFGDVLARLAHLLGLGDRDLVPSDVLERLHRETRAQLLEWTRRLGLTGVSRLTRDALLARIEEALQALGLRAKRPGGDDPDAKEPVGPDVAHRFDLGRPAEPVVVREHIPWSYGQDRVTAMVLGPDRLYVYWEVTDEAIGRARGGLGAGGAAAWLNLRVYDVTGRLFDGTNAHADFDQKVERTDRQWFFDVGKPCSTAIVEIGLKSFEGYFVRIARSGRADFPRREPAPPGDIEWLTVHAETGAVDDPIPATGTSPGGAGHPVPPPVVPPAIADVLHGGRNGEHGVVLEERLVPGEAFTTPDQWRETFHTEWHEEGRTLEWHGPAVRTSWEAGPFETPVESPAFVEERHEGGIEVCAERGRTRVVYGPWQVVIRGLNARAERQVVATWELRSTWVTDEQVEHLASVEDPTASLGGSELARRGASERRIVGASERRLGGASEVWRIGASELRFLGATERVFVGASERRLRGASEWRWGGASERARGGASEQRGGASDAVLPYPTAGERRAMKG